MSQKAIEYTASSLHTFAAADTGEEFPLEATEMHQTFITIVEGELERALQAEHSMGIRDFESATRVALAEGGGLGAGAREVLDLVAEIR